MLKGYVFQKFNVALQGAAGQLHQSATSYESAGQEINVLLSEVKQSLVLQSKCNQLFSQNLLIGFVVVDSTENILTLHP